MFRGNLLRKFKRLPLFGAPSMGAI